MQVGFIHSNQGDKQEVNVSNKEFYFKEENSELIISENGGSIRAQVDDDCLVLKVIQKIPLASIEEASLQEGSTYFMEIGEKLTYKESTYELKSLDTSTSVSEIKLAAHDADEEITEDEASEKIKSEEVSLNTNKEKDDEKVEFEESSNTLPQDNIDQDSPIENNKDKFDESDIEDNDNGYSFQLDNNLAKDDEEERDSGTMSITQVLNVARLEEESKKLPTKKKANKKSKKKSKSKKTKKKSSSGLSLTTARDYKGNRAKRDSKKDSKKKSKSKGQDFSELILVGPFTRFLSALSLMFVTILFSSQFENEAINSLSSKATILINDQITKFVEFNINPEITKSLILLFMILFISNIIFSVSPTLFISGATTKGSFLTKRAKAILRTPFDFIAHFLPIFETPIIFDTPSFKEIITRGTISYRLRSFRYIPLVSLSIFTFLCVGYPIIEQGLSNSNPPEKINLPKALGKRPLKMKELLISKQFSQENIILRVPSTRPVYFIINKKTGRTLSLKNTTSNFLVTYKKTLESIPFFKYRYPYLSSYLSDEKSSYLVREDFSKILWGGEIIKGMATKDLMYLDFLAINQSKKVFDSFKLPYMEYRNLNKFTSFYRSEIEEVYLYISEDSLMQFARTGGSMRSSELSGLTFLARPKVKIEYFDAIEKAYKGTNETFLITQLKEVQSIISAFGNDQNKVVFKEFTQYLVEFLKKSDNPSAKNVANEILNLNILNN